MPCGDQKKSATVLIGEGEKRKKKREKGRRRRRKREEKGGREEREEESPQLKTVIADLSWSYVDT